MIGIVKNVIIRTLQEDHDVIDVSHKKHFPVDLATVRKLNQDHSKKNPTKIAA